MIQAILTHKIPITIAVTFYLFGFFITADLLGLSLREILVGLVAGAVGGITTLFVVLRESRIRQTEPAPTPVSP